jgi:hypothetical protein
MPVLIYFHNGNLINVKIRQTTNHKLGPTTENPQLTTENKKKTKNKKHQTANSQQRT